MAVGADVWENSAHVLRHQDESCMSLLPFGMWRGARHLVEERPKGAEIAPLAR